MRFLTLLIPGLLAATTSLLLTPLVRRLAILVGAVDPPGERKVHVVPVPRLGGLAVLAGLVAGFGAALTEVVPLRLEPLRGLFLGLALGAVPIVAVSLWDDVKALRPLPKILAHAVGAALAIHFGVVLGPEVHLFGWTITLGWFSVVLSFLWLVGITNAFNIVDGLDGLASGLALISSLSLAAVFVVARQPGMAAASLAVAGALLGFLPFNVHPARIFLGDTGSATVGFVLACFALKGGSTLSAGFATLVPVLVLGLPIVETLVSMARRVLRRAQDRSAGGVFEADRRHFHHRLMELGLDHRRAVLLLYGAGLATAAVGLLSVLVTAQQAGLLLVALVVAAFAGLSRLGYDELAIFRSGRVLELYERPALKRAFFVVLVDLLLVALSVWGAVGLKWDDWGLVKHRAVALQLVAVLAPILALVYARFGLYRGAWRLANVDDALKLGVATCVSTFLGLVVDRFALGGTVAGTMFVLCGLLTLTTTAGLRLSYRILAHLRVRGSKGRPVVIYGAGEGGALVLRELETNRALGLKAIGFLDDDPGKEDSLVNGLPVFGGLEALDAIALRNEKLLFVVSSSKIAPPRIEEARTACRRLGLEMRRMEVALSPMDPPAEPRRSPA